MTHVDDRLRANPDPTPADEAEGTARLMSDLMAGPRHRSQQSKGPDMTILPDNPHAAFAAALREFADFVEAHPDLPLLCDQRPEVFDRCADQVDRIRAMDRGVRKESRHG